MSEQQIKSLAELYWESIDWRKNTIHGLVIEAFVKGYLTAKEREP